MSTPAAGYSINPATSSALASGGAPFYNDASIVFGARGGSVTDQTGRTDSSATATGGGGSGPGSSATNPAARNAAYDTSSYGTGGATTTPVYLWVALAGLAGLGLFLFTTKG